MSLAITLKIGATCKKELIQIENRHTGEIVQICLSQVKGKQVRLRVVDNANNYKISREPDTFELTKIGEL